MWTLCIFVIGVCVCEVVKHTLFSAEGRMVLPAGLAAFLIRVCVCVSWASAP